MWIILAALIVGVAAVQWRAAAREGAAARNHPPTGQIVNVGDVPVHVMVMGEGPDLVLIHGASGNLRDFTFSLADKLAREYRVFMVDRPGLGWSGRPAAYAGPFNATSESPAEQAALARAAMQTLGLTRPIVVGHSYGGAVALAWALDDPGETAALVLLAAASNPWPGDLGLFYQINSTVVGGALTIPLISAFVPERTVTNSLSQIFAPQIVPDGYGSHIAPDLTLRRASLRANAQQVNSLRPHVVEMAARYANLILPVEIVHGDADTIVPLDVHSRPLHALLPDSALTILPGIGHMPQHSAEADVLAAIHRAAERAGLR